MRGLANRLARLSGVVAVTLGGSRGQGTHRPDSDWDFGLYYRGTIDADEVRGLGYEGTVVSPGDWAYPMNGGAWLAVEGQEVDILYRDLDDVERWIAESEQGRWELYRVPGYLAGMPSYTLVAELALGEVLFGSLPHPAYPPALRESAYRRWNWEANFALEHADSHRQAGDVAACAGKCALAILALSHARLAASGRWVLNEKGIVGRAQLKELDAAFPLNNGDGAIIDLIEQIRRELHEVDG
jgi:Nucleotidyltransferase domain